MIRPWRQAVTLNSGLVDSKRVMNPSWPAAWFFYNFCFPFWMQILWSTERLSWTASLILTDHQNNSSKRPGLLDHHYLITFQRLGIKNWHIWAAASNTVWLGSEKLQLNWNWKFSVNWLSVMTYLLCESRYLWKPQLNDGHIVMIGYPFCKFIDNQSDFFFIKESPNSLILACQKLIVSGFWVQTKDIWGRHFGFFGNYLINRDKSWPTDRNRNGSKFKD